MKAIVGHRYQHYKNRKTYQVVALGLFTETEPLTPCVVYRAEYDDPELGSQPTFIRPQAMFEETVTTESGEVVERFIDITSSTLDT